MKLILFFISLLSIPASFAQQVTMNGSLVDEPIEPIPLVHNQNLDKVALGEKLFEDPYLAHDENQSCAQCHQISQGGDDGVYRSRTNSGTYDLINTPTIFNVAFNIRHTWRGKFKTLEMQVQGDLHNPRHANTTWKQLLPKLESRSDYKAIFTAIYGDKHISKTMVLDAFASYEKSLITPNAPFDKFLRGDSNAISAQVKKGYKLFKVYGCITCHQGINIGGNMFQKMGVFGDYFEHRKNVTKADFGRFNVTGLEKDRFAFRVPSLRNVAVTAPYFHDGQTETLEEAVDVMVKHQLGRNISVQNKKDVIAFLHSLTGEYKGKSLKKDDDK